MCVCVYFCCIHRYAMFALAPRASPGPRAWPEGPRSPIVTTINRIAIITTINRIAIITTINRIAIITTTTTNRIAITTTNRIAIITTRSPAAGGSGPPGPRQ